MTTVVKHSPIVPVLAVKQLMQDESDCAGVTQILAGAKFLPTFM